MARDDRSSLEKGSFPAGNGGRVRVPIHHDGEDGMDASINPLNQIYSRNVETNGTANGAILSKFDNLDDVEG